MNSPANIYYQNNHVPPYRFYLRQGKDYYGLIDLQIKAELKHIDDKDKQEHSLSIYVKPPINVHYKLHSAEHTVHELGHNKVQFQLQTIEDSELRNPYISWHGSGEIHANAYKSSKSQRTVRIVDNKKAITWRDVVMRYSLVLRAIVPLHEMSHLRVQPDLGNSLDLSSGVKVKDIPFTPDSIVLDNALMQMNTVTIDVFIHNRGYQIRSAEDLPYPAGAELIWLGSPLTFQNNESVFAPAVSVLAYQSAENSEVSSFSNPLILNGISKDHPYDDIYIQALLINQDQ